MLIRRERTADDAAVRAVLTDAFADTAAPGDLPVEVGLVEALRGSAEWLPPLALVAEAERGDVVGSVICTRGWVDEHPALGLGPLAVAPAAQRTGVGAALMHAVLGAADALDEPLVVLLGHAAYYPRFGFRPAAELGVAPPVAEWAPHFQARPLSAYRTEIHGSFRYAEPFMEL